MLDINKQEIKKIIVATAIITTYICISLFFKSHFYFGTIVNGINISGKTVEQAEKKINRKIETYTISLEERNSIVEDIKGKEIDLKYNKNEILDNIINKQKSSIWIYEIFKRKNYVHDKFFNYDIDLLKESFEKLNCLNDEKTIEPKSASLKFNGIKYEIIDEVYGDKVKKDELFNKIEEAIQYGKVKVNIGEVNCYEKPIYTSNSLELIEAKKICDKYVSSKIVYTFDEATETVDRGVISSWITIDENLNARIDKEKIKEYVQELSRKYDTYGKTRIFATSVGKEVEVKGGNYGFRIDKDKEYTELINAIESGQSIVKEPVYIQKAKNRGDNDIGKTYVEVNITRQQLWFYKDGELVTRGSVVTGNVERGWKTPNGTYVLNYKQKDAVLRGDNYASKVKYWMPFNGNIGLHDASWRGAFGGNVYKNDGTHGCVNLPSYLAKKIFDNIEEGTPIICYTE
ncbi:peptidoglycan-binding protein [Clostridium neonatale]|uniref:Peptidoglycan-binding protein n=2 Tax=Clostridium neonatale TaxID=137838 RepID=A0A2A7MFJ9_9CLOT|nr:L,D-transpeptidase/peptidoglycan binding protein [Clostridium neonatale]MBS4782101.1 L,D-transpeptidase/peptidoglycan binding protein [Clostridium sp.]PEG25935.1 peptidoglycan-binding protein [Clostridium neonatale]PEG30612.1 peptidoglycan-binding protein [Clostridium neonatale]